jgi:CTP:molybdopterin cytidylyltransferase MocA
MPGLRVDVVRSLLEAFETVPLNSIVVPVYADEPKRIGHPVLFGSAYRNDLLALTGDSGARSIIDSAGGRLVHIFVGGSLPDLDEPE